TVLINDAQATKSAPVVSDAAGDFVFVNVSPGTYTLEVSMPAFKTLRKSGLTVTPGSRTTAEGLTLEIGRATETVTVRGETPDLPGGVRPIQRPADHGRHQERHERVPRLAVRCRAQFQLEREQQAQQAERRSEGTFTAARLGLLDRRPGWPRGRKSPAVLFLQP